MLWQARGTCLTFPTCMCQYVQLSASCEGVGTAIAKLAMGDNDAVQECQSKPRENARAQRFAFLVHTLGVACLESLSQELVQHVGGAPCVAHAAAVASSALRSLLLNRPEEA